MNTKNTLLRHRFVQFKEITQEEDVIIKHMREMLNIDEDTSILDIGAGDGTISRNLQSNVSNIFLVEIDEFDFPEEITVFKDTWEDAAIDGNYDIVLASHVWGHFHYTKSIKEAFSKMKKSTNRGGRLVVCYNTNLDFVGSLIKKSKSWFNSFQYDIFDETLLVGLEYSELHFSVTLKAKTFEELAGLVQVLIIVSDEEFEEKKSDIVCFLENHLKEPAFEIKQKIVSIVC